MLMPPLDARLLGPYPGKLALEARVRRTDQVQQDAEHYHAEVVVPVLVRKPSSA